MKLSVCSVTRNSGDRLEAWIAQVLEFADEVVLLVDGSSSDNTLDVARRTSDYVQVFEHPPVADLAIDWALRKATGDWILILADDEIISLGFRSEFEQIASNSLLTHFYVPIRWVIPKGPDLHWISSYPWKADAVRLFRNIGSLFHYPGDQHQPAVVVGEAHRLDGDKVAIYHMDLAWRPRKVREEKVRRYQAHAGDSGEGHFYLYEDHLSVIESVPIQPNKLALEPSPRAMELLAERRARFANGSNYNPDLLTIDQMRRHVAPFKPATNDIFAAEYRILSSPRSCRPNWGGLSCLEITNRSTAIWRNSGQEQGMVLLSYHWLTPDGSRIDGVRSMLPFSVRSGETVLVEARFQTPAKPGPHILEWGLVSEKVAWFSDRGVEPLRIAVEIEG